MLPDFAAGRLDFEALQLRLHPAASRVAKLAAETPAHFVAFDLLALGDSDLTGRPFAERRAALEQALAAARSPGPPHPCDDRPGDRRPLVHPVRRAPGWTAW